MAPQTTGSPFDNNRRRRRILFTNTQFVFGAYCITQLATLIAKLFDFSSVSYSEILLVTGITLGSTVLFLIAVRLKREFPNRFVNVVFFGQFGVWLVMYTVWFITLREIRVMALFFALMALIFTLSNSTFLQSISIAIAASIIQVAGSYVAIHRLGQPGSFALEVFYTCCFIPSALFISSIAGQYARQREEIKSAKNMAESARDALWGEMELAKKIQTVLLPSRPEIPGYEIDAFMAPADEVGGDYYDIINVGGMDWIAIGDVSGHGVPAGLIMMMVQTSIRSILTTRPDLPPSELLTAVNESLANNIRLVSDDKYMTITILAAHRDGRFTFSGLHQDLMVFRARTGVVDVVESDGIWLGVLPNINRMNVDKDLVLAPGDTMLLYTDGITEAMDANREMFSEDRLKDVLRAHGAQSPERIKRAILDAMSGFTPRDDLTLVIIKHR